MIIRNGMCHPDEDCPVNDFVHTHQLPEAFDRGFGMLKGEIDPFALHDMASIRANIAMWRMGLRPDATGALREDNDMGRVVSVGMG